MKLMMIISLLTAVAAGVHWNANPFLTGKPDASDNDRGELKSMRVENESESEEVAIFTLDRDALIDMERQWNEALQTHNGSWFEKNLADDFTDVSSANGALSTKVEDIANLKVDKTVYGSLELSNLRARVEGSAGVVTGVNHIRGQSEGQSFDLRLSFTDTYIKRHGRWQAWASQHTRVRP